jgi:RNA polymerase sigma-70 factor (ECF subfamily)
MDRVALLDDAPDALLAQRAADGDELAFAVIVRRHAPYLRAYVIRLTGASADADDAVQDALITAWERLGELTEPERLRSWLTTIASRKAIDRARGRRPETPIDDFDTQASQSGPEERAVAASGVDELGRVLRELPADQREIWIMKEVGGLSYDEIAERTDSSVSTVRGRLARARATVLERMEGWR